MINEVLFYSAGASITLISSSNVIRGAYPCREFYPATLRSPISFYLIQTLLLILSRFSVSGKTTLSVLSRKTNKAEPRVSVLFRETFLIQTEVAVSEGKLFIFDSLFIAKESFIKNTIEL